MAFLQILFASLLVVPLVACVPALGAEPSVQSTSQEATLPVTSSFSLDLRPDAGGWGRLVLEAQEDVTLTVGITHDTMEDLTLFSDDGEGIYDEKHFTVFRLDSDDGGVGGWFFDWWGTPSWAIWPHSTTDVDPDANLALDAGETGFLLAATNVGGYTLHVAAQGASGVAPVSEWTLGPREGFELMLPEVEDTALAQNELARVERNRRWDEERTLPAGVLTAQSWTLREEVTARAGVESDQLGITQVGGTGLVASSTGPSFDLITGGYHYSALRLWTYPQDEGDFAFFRHLRETGLGLESIDEGAAFLSIPSGPST